MSRLIFLILLIEGLYSAAIAETESPHVAGPNGVEGWTVLAPYAGKGDLPVALVLSKNGKAFQRYEGSPFLWQWKFLSDGNQVAFQRGPLHFSMVCDLADVSTGEKLETVDCFRYDSAEHRSGGWPEWVNKLFSNPSQ